MEKDTQGFGLIDDAFAVISERGVMRQVSLYERSGKVYAKKGAGFVAIMNDGKTTAPNVVCKGINCKGIIWKQNVYGILEIDHESS